jgi:hydrogenase maturation protein HypF
MLLESLCRSPVAPVAMPLYKDVGGVWCGDWEPLLDGMTDEQMSQRNRAEIFHSSMSQLILRQAQKVRDEHELDQVGLCGGVFQNRVLTEQVVDLLQGDGFRVYVPAVLPCNDAALSFGQAAELAARDKDR